MPKGDPNVPNVSSSVPYPLVYVRALAEHRWSEFCRAVRTPIENRIRALAWTYFLDDPRAPLRTKGTTPPEPAGPVGRVPGLISPTSRRSCRACQRRAIGSGAPPAAEPTL